MRGRVNPDSRLDLEVHVLLDRPMQLETVLRAFEDAVFTCLQFIRRFLDKLLVS